MTMGANTSSKPPVFDENEDGKKCVIVVCKIQNFAEFKYKRLVS